MVVRFAVGEDKSADADRLRAMEELGSGAEKEYWDRPERRNRWYAQSCVVAGEWQGRGIGKRLMAEVIARAESEGVVVGLESSEMGERLYRSLGFELLGRFKKVWDEMDENVGGVMMYTPMQMREVKI